MTDHDVIERDERSTDSALVADSDLDERTAAYVDFLAAEFPEWQFAVDATATWSGDAKELWIATREGHHPQSELTAGKLHRRLTDYERRRRHRRSADN